MSKDIEKHPIVSQEVQYEVGEVNDVALEPDPSSGGPIYRWLMDWKPVHFLDDDSHLEPSQRAIAASTKVPLKRRLKTRHLQMIGIGGSIGAGLFISSGSALAAGGGGGLIIGFAVIGILIYCTMNALGELGVRYPVNGAFSAYNYRFLDHSWGFAIGWVYAIGWLITMPNELIAAAVTLGYWKGDHNGATEVNRAAWVGLFLATVLFINVFGVRGYGEAEFIFSFIKVVAVIGFNICGIVIACGGGPNHDYIGGKYWHNPGAFAHGAKGVFKVFVTAAYSFSGTEFAGLAAAETQNPREAVPRACKQVFWRILLFYLVSVIMMATLVPYDNDRLGTASNASASPFVIAINLAGIKALPSIMNVVILLAVVSVANAAVFGSTRTLVALAAQGHAPKQLLWIDNEGRPVTALIIALCFGGLAFISAWDGYGQVFDWLSALGGMSSLWTWGSVSVCHLRNRLAMKKNGLDPKKDLDFAAPGGYTIPIVGMLLAALTICLQFWIALFPLGWTDPGADHNGASQAKNFFETWLSTCIILVLFVGHKIYTRDWSYVRLENIDVFTGVRNPNIAELRESIAVERAQRQSKSWPVRVYNIWC